eukprot:6860722-Prymnesium_polylepis.1
MVHCLSRLSVLPPPRCPPGVGTCLFTTPGEGMNAHHFRYWLECHAVGFPLLLARVCPGTVR